MNLPESWSLLLVINYKCSSLIGHYYGQWKTGVRCGYGLRSGVCKRDEKTKLPHYARTISRQSVESIKLNGTLLDSKHPKSTSKKLGASTELRCQTPKSACNDDGENVSQAGSLASSVSDSSKHSSVVSDVINGSNVGIQQIPLKTIKEVYKGEWKADKRHGYGVVECSDQYNYTGQWHENMRHGFGTAILPDGTKLEGEWENDILINDIRKKGALVSCVTRLRQRLRLACEAAQQAKEMATQKSDMALSRATAARDRSSDADTAAEHAREAAIIARARAQKLISELSANESVPVQSELVPSHLAPP